MVLDPAVVPAPIPGAHPLDNAVWAALRSAPDDRVDRVDGAARFRRDIAPFYAVDVLDRRGWAALAELAGPRRGLALFRDEVSEPPPGWERIDGGIGHQLVLDDLRPVPPVRGARDLGDDDVPAMLDLVRQTQPGPFLERTIELGGYRGVFRDGRLVAMAGQRLRPPGFTEVSAVCTDPAFTRQGFATALTHQVASAALARGDTVFLHVAATNERARRVYERMGFRHRRSVHLAVLRTPPDARSASDGANP